jgi:hypothetical protein
VLELAVVVFDAPADLGQTDQVGDRGVGGQIEQPVFGGGPSPMKVGTRLLITRRA